MSAGWPLKQQLQSLASAGGSHKEQAEKYKIFCWLLFNCILKLFVDVITALIFFAQVQGYSRSNCYFFKRDGRPIESLYRSK